MDDSAAAALSVIITRSRLTGPRAYVRFGDFEAGFRDLRTGEIHSAEGYAAHVAGATEGLAPRQAPRPAPVQQLAS